jgi:hypothetical protein
MTDGEPELRLRDALPPELPIAPHIRQRMLAVIAAELTPVDQIAARRRRRWLPAVAAAALLLAVGVGVAMPGSGHDGSRVGDMEQAAPAPAAAGQAPTDEALPEDAPPQLTPGNIAAYARAQLDGATESPRSAAGSQAQSACTGLTGRPEPATVTSRVYFQGIAGLLLVFADQNSFTVWVVAPDCPAAGAQVLFHADYGESRTQ